MPLICHVYTMYIPCIYNSRFDIPVIYQGYSLYILHGISSVYTVHIQFICIVYFVYIPCIYHVYTWYIYGIYMVYTWYIIYSIRWLVLWRRAGAPARAYPPAGQRLHTVTQARPRARARAHIRTSAHTRARKHLAVVRFPRPDSANTEVANERNA